MKELSIEEKARRYDEAIERANNLHKDAVEMKNNMTTKTCEIIFPELKESEDERIRKCIGDVVREYDWAHIFGVTKDDCLSWLKKQGEQKPANKVEPKFHEGDMIIHKELGGDYIHNPHKIIQVDILDKKYRLEGGLVAHFGEQDDYELVEQNPAWSEEDKKIFNLIVARLHSHPSVEAEEYDKDYHWLKSLKERYTWKPSDEQMDALHYVTNFDYGGHKATLVSLYEQLKKLREELV